MAERVLVSCEGNISFSSGSIIYLSTGTDRKLFWNECLCPSPGLNRTTVSNGRELNPKPDLPLPITIMIIKTFQILPTVQRVLSIFPFERQNLF